MSLVLVPGIPLREVNAFVARRHRHHPPVRGCLFNLAASDGICGLVAVASVGRPVSRMLQAEGHTAEVTRLCVDPEWEDAFALGRAAGSYFLGRERGLRGLALIEFVLRRGLGSSVASMLYGAAWRAARELGFRRLVTYTLPEEGGASLRGAGWKLIGEAGGGSWSRPSRARIDRAPTQTKLRWEAA